MSQVTSSSLSSGFMYGKIYARMIVGVVLLALAVLILLSMFGSKNQSLGSFLASLSSKKPEFMNIDNIVGTGPKSNRTKQLMDSRDVEDEMPDLMHPNDAMALAQKIKNAGVVVYGQSGCPRTVEQRRLFGKKGTPARDLFESVYVECRHPMDCPGISSVPTWAFGETKRPGAMNPASIEAFLDQAQYSTGVQMLQEPAEPVDGNIQGEQNAQRNTFLPDPSVVAFIDAAVSQRVKEILEKQKKEDEEKKAESQKEAMRGLAPLADKPLNSVVAPGGSAMLMNDNDRWNEAAIQGAGPRVSMSNRDFVDDLAATAMTAVMDAFNSQGSNGSVDSAAVNNSYLPHSTQITVGDAFVDNRTN